MFCLSGCGIRRLSPSIYCPVLASKKAIWLHDIEPSQLIEKEGELLLLMKGLLFMLICRIWRISSDYWFISRNSYVQVEVWRQWWVCCFFRAWGLRARRIHRNTEGLDSLVKPRQRRRSRLKAMSKGLTARAASLCWLPDFPAIYSHY